MKLSRIVIAAGLAFVAFASIGLSRSILERKMHYLSDANKIGETKYWFVYLGSHECTLNRKYPGYPVQPVTGTMNLSFMSSGYIEGTGYSVKGRLECIPTMKMVNGNGQNSISIDSIDCIYDYGHKVRMITGETGDLIIDVEGQPKTANRFTLTEYKMINIDGEKELKKTGVDTPLYAISFSKTGIAWAKKASAETAAPAATESPKGTGE